MEETIFRLKQYNIFLQQNAAAINAFKARQQVEFEAERERWKNNGQEEYASEAMLAETDAQSEPDLPEGSCAISAHVTGTVWELLVEPGHHVTAGSPLLIVESMKMEIAVDAPVNGTVWRLCCKESGNVSVRQMLLVIQED